MLTFVRTILSSASFLLAVAVAGLLLFTWPMVTMLADHGPGGQLSVLFAVWLLLVAGALAWSAARKGAAGPPPGREGSLACTWPQDKGEGRQ